MENEKQKLTNTDSNSATVAGYKELAGHYLYFRKKPVIIEAVRVKEILEYYHQ